MNQRALPPTLTDASLTCNNKTQGSGLQGNRWTEEPAGHSKPFIHPWHRGIIIWLTRASWRSWRVKVRRGEGQSSPRYHHLSPPLPYRLWPAEVANGRASPCHSKSHFCPLRLALPVLTERGSEAEGEKRERADRGIFFRCGFLSISVCLSKQETVASI